MIDTTTPLPDELPGGIAWQAMYREAETKAAALPSDKWHRATPAERERMATDAAITRRRANEQVRALGYATVGDFLAATDGEPDAPVSLARFLAMELDPPAWIVGDLIPKGPAIGGLFGAEKAGKSLAGLQLCFAVATGADFLGHEIDNPGATLFVEYEGSKPALQRRAATIAAKYGALQPDVPVNLSIVHRPAVKLDTDAGEAWLTRHCTGRVLCVIGPVSKAATITKEADQAEWARLSARLQAATDATGCTILLVHHTRKPDRQFGPPSKVGDFMNSVRGSNAFLGAVDVAIGVQRDPESAEGVLYFLEREGASGRTAYTFDVSSLCIFPDDRPLTRPKLADRVALVRDYIAEHPGCRKVEMARDLGIIRQTLDNYLANLEPELEITEGGPGKPNTYRLAA